MPWPPSRRNSRDRVEALYRGAARRSPAGARPAQPPRHRGVLGARATAAHLRTAPDGQDEPVVSPQHPLATHGAPIPTTVLAEYSSSYTPIVRISRRGANSHICPENVAPGSSRGQAGLPASRVRVRLHAAACGRGRPGKRRARSDLGRGHTARGQVHSHVGHLPDDSPPGPAGRWFIDNLKQEDAQGLKQHASQSAAASAESAPRNSALFPRHRVLEG